MAVRVRAAAPADAPAWETMRRDLWPDHGEGYHGQEIARFFAGETHEPLAALIAIDDAGAPVGFAELSIRNIVDSCTTDRVAYLEGWYVVPRARGQGVGAALVRAAEAWGLAQGCTEFGSDVLIDNEASARAHLALGFEETSRVRNFRKALG
jgi:aminoglycoside 6'-N-acetyltransferase I